jgi:hypothetical protein
MKRTTLQYGMCKLGTAPKRMRAAPMTATQAIAIAVRRGIIQL